MTIQKAIEQNRPAIVDLLKSQKLPSEDLPETLPGFFVALEENRMIGLIGLERYGHYGLLRSLVVDPAYRNRRIAEKLVQQLEETATASGIKTLYLLTETAEAYFNRKGYEKTARSEVPPDLLQSSEFSHVCPVSATVMKKQLAAETIQV